MITIVADQFTAAPDHHGIFSGWQWEFLRAKLLRAGLNPEECTYIKRSENMLPHTGLVLGLGERALQQYTGKKGIDKWQLSPLNWSGGKFIPTFGFDRIQKQFELGLYLELAIKRAYEESKTQNYEDREERFQLNPNIEETFALLDYLKTQDKISVDVETGYGQINTVGFAWSPNDAIAINTLPGRCSDSLHYETWKKIRTILESDSHKIFQNFIYDTSYFSAYGIRVRNLTHDTMWAMKVLWPELDMNLGNVGRFYTRRPYWKDDGKIESEEGKKKDWGNIRDWGRHYLYNCRDTSGTFEAHLSQRKDLNSRGLLNFYETYLLKLAPAILEMCSNGFTLDLERRQSLQSEIEQKVTLLTAELHKEVGFELNPRSPKQVMTLLRDSGVTLPKKYDKEKGGYREAADATALKKIRLKHPELKFLDQIIGIKTLQTALSRYINFDTKPGEAKLRYSLIGTGTETLRFAGGTDPWDRGFNIQTIPQEGGEVSIKSMLIASPGNLLAEIDLKQAESRFVAYDAADKTLIDMLESNYDIHSHVAKEIIKIFGQNPDAIPKTEFKQTWRQLGKKAGHGANYAMKENTFVETCFSEMDLNLTREQARNTLESYHRLFPGIRRWHSRIRAELNLKRKLTAPSGWERYFYGRFGNDMFKEAYAWRPQHTIPWVMNHLILFLIGERTQRRLNFKLIVQVHDSVVLEFPESELEKIARACLEFKKWHPPVTLAGGDMWIPTEFKYGKRMNELEEWEGQL